MEKFFNNINQQGKNALGKLFRSETNRYFSTKDNKLWDLIVYHNPSNIFQKLAWLVMKPTQKADGSYDWVLDRAPNATRDNLRYIKRSLLADWRKDRLWFAVMYPPVGGPATIEMATPENIRANKIVKLANGRHMTRFQMLNLLKRGYKNDGDGVSAHSMAPARVDVNATWAGSRTNPNCGTGTIDHPNPLLRCSYDIQKASQKPYNGFSRFGSFWDEATADDQENTEYDSRAGYYIDRALGLAFDLAGNVIGNWDGKDVVNQSGQRIPPPSTGISPTVIFGGAVVLALLMKK